MTKPQLSMDSTQEEEPHLQKDNPPQSAKYTIPELRIRSFFMGCLTLLASCWAHRALAANQYKTDGDYWLFFAITVFFGFLTVYLIYRIKKQKKKCETVFHIFSDPAPRIIHNPPPFTPKEPDLEEIARMYEQFRETEEPALEETARIHEQFKEPGPELRKRSNDIYVGDADD
jgi:hypothetical protein